MFISFAGIECCGKSTLSKNLDLHLSKQGKRVTHTREPGGTKFAERVRHILLDKQYEIPPLTEVLMFYAGRVEHTQTKIIPAINSGHIVITDRYYESTLAYQSLICDRTQDIHNACMAEMCIPDLVFLIDIPATVSVERMIKQRQNLGIMLDRIEQRPVEFFERARQNFLKNADDRYVILDGMKPLKELNDEIIKITMEHL